MWGFYGTITIISTGDAIGDEEEPLWDCNAKMDSVFKVKDGATGDPESDDIVLSTAVDDTVESPDQDAGWGLG